MLRLMMTVLVYLIETGERSYEIVCRLILNEFYKSFLQKKVIALFIVIGATFLFSLGVGLTYTVIFLVAGFFVFNK